MTGLPAAGRFVRHPRTLQTVQHRENVGLEDFRHRRERALMRRSLFQSVLYGFGPRDVVLTSKGHLHVFPGSS